MRIVIDLDGTLCYTRKPEQSYSDVEPIPGAIEAVKELKKAGHYVIIATSRHMKTCNGNVGQIVAKVGKVTLEWLDKHGIMYDEVCFGKSLGHVSIDDRAIQFKGNWRETLEELSTRKEDF